MHVSGKPYVVDAEFIQRLGYLDLLLGIEEGIGELLSLAKRRLDDLEVAHIAEKIADGLVWVSSMSGGLDARVAGMGCMPYEQTERLPERTPFFG